MVQHGAAGAAATASMLRQLADEIEQGVVRVEGGSQLCVSDAGVSAVVDGAEMTEGRLSVVVQLEGRRGEREASELERELAHPGD